MYVVFGLHSSIPHPPRFNHERTFVNDIQFRIGVVSLGHNPHGSHPCQIVVMVHLRTAVRECPFPHIGPPIHERSFVSDPSLHGVPCPLIVVVSFSDCMINWPFAFVQSCMFHPFSLVTFFIHIV